MIAERVDNFAAAVHQIDDAFGEPGFFQQLDGAAEAEWNALGGFDDESVAACDGVGEEPVGDHRGKIEGNDGGDNTEWLADLHFIHAGSHVLKVVALHHHGDAARDFDVFDTAPEFGFGFCESFSIFDGDESRKFVDVFFEKILELEQILNTFARRSTAPRGKSVGGSLDGSIDVGGSRHGCASDEFAGGGIGDVVVVLGRGTAPTAVDVVLELGDLRGYGAAHDLLLGACNEKWLSSASAIENFRV
jgi:hypothetical protein